MEEDSIARLLSEKQWGEALPKIIQASELQLSNKNIGVSLLHTAIKNGAPHTLIAHLIDKGISPNEDSQNSDGKTPIHQAIIHNACQDTLQLLLRRGGNPMLHDNLGLSPLHYASKEKAPDVNLVKVLLDSGVNVNLNDGDDRQTPLHVAAEFGSSRDLVALLVEYGADLRLNDACGNTPVEIARNKGHDHLIDLLTLETQDESESSRSSSSMDSVSEVDRSLDQTADSSASTFYESAAIISPTATQVYSPSVSTSKAADTISPSGVILRPFTKTPTTTSSQQDEVSEDSSNQDVEVEEEDPAKVLEEEGQELLKRAALIRQYRQVELPRAEDELATGEERVKRLRSELDEVESRNFVLKEKISDLREDIESLSKRDKHPQGHSSSRRSTCVIS